MPFDLDLKTVITVAIALANFAGLVFLYVSNSQANDKLTNNDLHHIAEDIKEVKKGQDLQGKKIDSMEKDISYLKGSRESESKVLDLLSKALNK